MREQFFWTVWFIVMGALAFVLFGPPANAQVMKVTICHIPPGNPNAARTIVVAAPSTDSPGIAAHVAHGDKYGSCEGDNSGTGFTHPNDSDNDRPQSVPNSNTFQNYWVAPALTENFVRIFLTNHTPFEFYCETQSYENGEKIGLPEPVTVKPFSVTSAPAFVGLNVWYTLVGCEKAESHRLIVTGLALFGQRSRRFTAHSLYESRLLLFQ